MTIRLKWDKEVKGRIPAPQKNLGDVGTRLAWGSQNGGKTVILRLARVIKPLFNYYSPHSYRKVNV